MGEMILTLYPQYGNKKKKGCRDLGLKKGFNGSIRCTMRSRINNLKNDFEKISVPMHSKKKRKRLGGIHKEEVERYIRISYK